MKSIICIKSCHKHRSLHQAQRDTWINNLPAGMDYRFFVGSPVPADGKLDEVFVDAPDGYHDLNYKLVRTLEWALAHGYDFIFYCDPDTYINPVNMASSGYENYDYVGGEYGCQDIMFASGGSGYWMSAKAARWIVNDPVVHGPRHMKHVIDNGHDDVFVAETLRFNGVSLHHDARYLFKPDAELTPETIAYHCSSVHGWGSAYSVGMMYAAYEKQVGMNATPTASVICPTANRPEMLLKAIKCFLDQDFYASEMLILDDGAEPSAVPSNSRIKYIRTEGGKHPVGTKRNRCCEAARGSIICHFDDDDWSAPTRLKEQIKRLDNVSVTGYNSIAFFNTDKKWAAIWKGCYQAGAGYSYRKDFWAGHRFENWTGGEDCAFYESAVKAGQFDSVEGHTRLVCTRHETNTWWAGDMAERGFSRVPLTALPSAFLVAQGIPILPITASVLHGHTGYCRKHKALGCPECTRSGSY